MDTDVPNPGSPDAIARGCRCPIFDNGHGRGYLGGKARDEYGNPIFAVMADCPLHAHHVSEEAS